MWLRETAMVKRDADMMVNFAKLVRSKPRSVRLFALTPLLLALLGARPHNLPMAKAAWTVMIYQDLDNSLETPGLENLKEMIRVGGSDNVQVVVLCDRSPK